jgi:outer membrane protein, heavy metal efflux system
MKILLITILTILLAPAGGFSQKPEDFFRIAAENSPGLQVRYLEFEAALQKIPQVKALPDPTIMFGYTVWPAESMPGAEKARLSLNQMFPWFGTLKAKGDLAALQAEAKYQAFIDSRNNLFFQVASAWYPLYEINRLRLIEQENIRILESYKNIAIRNFENGTGPMVNVLRSDIMLKEAETRLVILDDREKSMLSVFNNLLNRNPDEGVEIPDSIQIENLKIITAKDSLLSFNPLITEIELRQKAAEVNQELARKQGFPNIGIGLEYMIMGAPAGMESTNNLNGAIMPMVSVSVPLFRKKYKAAQEEARLMQESIAFQKQNSLNKLSSDYDMAWYDLQQQQKLIELFDRQIKTSEQSLNLLFRSYSNSGNDFEEVLRMQQQLLQYEKEKASAETKWYTSLAKMNYLTAKTINDNENK